MFDERKARRKSARQSQLVLSRNAPWRKPMKLTLISFTKFWSKFTQTLALVKKAWASWIRLWTTSSSELSPKPLAWPSTERKGPWARVRFRPLSGCFYRVSWPNTLSVKGPRLWPSTPVIKSEANFRTVLKTTALLGATTAVKSQYCQFSKNRFPAANLALSEKKGLSLSEEQNSMQGWSNSKNKPRGLYFSKALFEGLIIKYGGKFASQNRLTIFALFYLVFECNFQVRAPRGLIFGGAISRKVFCVTRLIFAILRYVTLWDLMTIGGFRDFSVNRVRTVLKSPRIFNRESRPVWSTFTGCGIG